MNRPVVWLFALISSASVFASGCGEEQRTDSSGSGAASSSGGVAGSGAVSAGASTAGRAGASGGAPSDAGTLDGLRLGFEVETPEQIGIYLIVEGALPDESRVDVRYKRVADADFRRAHPLLRIHPEWVGDGAPEVPVDSFAGTIFDLVPGTEYDVEIGLTQPGLDAQVLTTRAWTRALPGMAPPATVSAGPSDDLQAILNALAPGAVLELDEGVYEVDGLYLELAGTESAPIFIRGKSREGVVLHSDQLVLQLRACSHVVVESLTLEGSGIDSGTDASSVGVSFWDGASQEFVTFRDLDVRGVDKGIIGYGPLRSILIYGSSFLGNNLWNEAFVETNLTWNDDGITTPGLGNCAFENTLHGFGDSFAVRDGTHSAGVHFYRNRITMTGDDAFEADYGTRNLSFYDNSVFNSATLLSLDPLWGGPLYLFRNVSVNTVRGPFKLNNTNSGFLVYSNTIVRTEGTTDWGWVQFNNGELRNYAFQNNILIYRGDSGNLLALESGGNEPLDWTNNAWYPDGAIWWSATGGSYESLAEAQAALPATRPLFSTSSARHENDLIAVENPFAVPVALGASHLTEIADDVSLALAPDTTLRNAGVEIANVTDGFTGAAPDLGAVIEGRTVVRRGAERP